MKETSPNSSLLPLYQRYPVQFSHGQGARLFTEGGEDYLDFASGIAVNALGHNHPRLVRALAEQARRLIHVSNLYGIREQALLAEKLREWLGYEHFFFCNSGTEANEAALKLVKAYGNLQGKKKIVVAKNGFHGRTLGSLSLTAQEEFQNPFLPLLPGIEVVEFGNLSALERVMDEEVAGVFLEPIQAEGGGIFPPPGYLQGVRALTRRYGAILVWDEVQTGIGRTGAPLYTLKEGVKGDLVTLAKGLGGGVPVGALGVNPPFTEVLKPGMHASTFGGNPLAMAAALVVVEELARDSVLEEIESKGRIILETLREWEKAGLLSQPRGAGLLIFFQVPEPRRLTHIALKERVLVAPAKQGAVRILPPLLITEEEIAEGLSRLHRALIHHAEEVPHGTPSS